jgi:hypothetical protein
VVGFYWMFLLKQNPRGNILNCLTQLKRDLRMGFLMEGQITKLLTAPNLTPGAEHPTRINEACVLFFVVVVCFVCFTTERERSCRMRKKERERERESATLGTRTVTFLTCYNLHISGRLFQELPWLMARRTVNCRGLG